MSSLTKTITLSLVLCLLGAIGLEFALPPPRAGNVFSVNDVLKIAIQGRYDLAQILISWALGLVGGLIILLKFEIEGKLAASQLQLSIIFVSAVCSFMSTYFGHLYLDRLGLILSHQLNPFRDSYLGLLGFSQYLLLSAALILAITSYLIVFVKD